MHPHDVPSVSVDALPTGAVLLDCREDNEWQAGHIEGAVHVPMNQIPNRVFDGSTLLTPDVGIVVVCKVGSRSAHVTEWLNRNGFNAANLEGGMLAWVTAGRPIVSSGGEQPHIL